MNAMEDRHQTVMTSALVAACRNASIAAGFPSVETASGIDGATRVIAADAAGRVLITEIHSSVDREPSMETEVVGVTDGSCVHILDEFDRALDEQGVRATSKDRKWTGGVCELEFAKQFLGKIQPASIPQSA